MQIEHGVKFCAKIQDNIKETFNKLTQVDRDQLLSWVQVFRWHNTFLDDRVTLKDKIRSDRVDTSIEKNEKMKNWEKWKLEK